MAISYWGKCILATPELLSWTPVRALRDNGFKIVSLDGSSEPDYYVAFEHSRRNLKLIRSTAPKAWRVLVAFEPESVNALNYSPIVGREYCLRLVGSHLQASESDLIYWAGGLTGEPELSDNMAASLTKVKKPGSICLVNANKFSLFPGSMYTLRFDTLKAFSSNGAKISLAGRLWDKGLIWAQFQQFWEFLRAMLLFGAIDLRLWRLDTNVKKYADFRGAVENSVEFQSEFEFSVVIENDPKYVSEKLFNAIQAGCVPIYVGPPLAEFGIPTSVAIEAAATPEAIYKGYEMISKNPDKVVAVTVAGREWIINRTTQDRWLHDKAFERIGNLLVSQLENINSPGPT